MIYLDDYSNEKLLKFDDVNVFVRRESTVHVM